MARTVPLPYSCASEVELGHQERSRAITKDSNSLFCMVSGRVLPQTGKAFTQVKTATVGSKLPSAGGHATAARIRRL